MDSAAATVLLQSPAKLRPSATATAHNDGGNAAPGARFPPSLRGLEAPPSAIITRDVREVIGAANSDRMCQNKFAKGMSNSVADSVVAQHLHMRRLDWSLGSAYRPQPIVARNSWSASASMTNHLCLALCFRPQSWLESSSGDDDGPLSPMRALPLTTLGKIYGWRSPRMLPGDALRGLLEVAKSYEMQYASLVPKKFALNFYQCVNAKAEEVTNCLRSHRQAAGPTGKVLFHYMGHGVSRPRGNFIFLQGSSSSGDGVKYTLDTLRASAQYPLIIIADCPSAGCILNYFKEVHRREEEQSMQRFRSTGGGAAGAQATGSTSNAANLGNVALGFVPSSSAIDLASSHGGDVSTRSNPAGMNFRTARQMSSSVSGSPVQASPPGFTQLMQSTNSIPVSIREDFFFIGACEEGDVLPSHAGLPNDILSSCLTTPVTVSILWFILSVRSLADVHPMLIHLMPGMLDDKKTPLGQLRWAFECYSESIAWSLLPPELFSRLYRQDHILSGVFRGYLLAHRLISQMNGSVTVYPPMPSSSHTHPLWDSWDMQVEKAVAALVRAIKPSPAKNLSCNEMRDFLDITTALTVSSQLLQGGNSVGCAEVVIQPHFLVEELKTIDATLDRFSEQGFYRYLTSGGQEPMPTLDRLPMLFQANLLLAHREEAIRLLCRFVDLGEPAVWQCVVLNFFSVATSIKSLWKHPASVGHRPALLFLYAKAMYVDPAILGDDTRREMLPIVLQLLQKPVTIASFLSSGTQSWQVKTLRQFALPAGQVALAASVVSMLAVRSSVFQCQCIDIGALDVCFDALVRCCPPVSPQMQPRGSISPTAKRSGRGDNDVLGVNSPFVSSVQQADTETLMTLTLLASIAALICNLDVIPDLDGRVGSDDGVTAPVPPLGSVSLSHFCDLIDRAIPCFRFLLGAEHQSVRLATTRTIAVILAHPCAIVMSSSKPQDKQQRDRSVSQSSRSSGSNAAPTFVSSLLSIVLERCEKSFPFEINLEVRLEEIGLLISCLLRHGKCLTDKIPMEVIRAQIMTAFRPSVVSVASSSASLLHKAGPSQSAVSGVALSELMSPFALPPMDSTVRSSRTVDGVAALESDDEADQQSIGGLNYLHVRHSMDFVGCQPSPLSTPFMGPKRVPPPGGAPPSGPVCHARVNRCLPSAVFEITNRAMGGANTLASLLPEGLTDEAAWGLCLALRHLVAASTDVCPTVRAHAEKGIDKLVSAKVLPNREQLNVISSAFGTSMRESYDRQGSSLQVGSKKRRFWDFLKPTAKPPVQPSKRATTTPPAARSPVPGRFPASIYVDDGEDEEVSLRTVDLHDASTIHPFIFSILRFLEHVTLVPLDDHDPRHPDRLNSSKALQHFRNACGDAIRRGSEASHEYRWETTFDKEVAEPVRTLVFHPTEKILAAGCHTDVVHVFSVDETREEWFRSKPLISFCASAISRRWQPRGIPYSFAPNANPFVQLGLAPPLNGSGFDTNSEYDSQSEAPLTPHGPTRSFPRGGGDAGFQPASALSTSMQSSVPEIAAPIGGACFIDASRQVPMLATIHTTGAVCLFALDLDSLFAARAAKEDAPSASIVRTSTFQTMPYENRPHSVQSVFSYHSPAQQLHIAVGDGSIASWDLTVEQMVGLRSTTIAASHGFDSSSLHLQPQSSSQFAASSAVLSGATAIGSHPVDPFRFLAGGSHLLLFDSRSSRPGAKLDAVRSGLQSCLHASFSVRYEHLIIGGFSADSSLVMWDDRNPGRPLTIYYNNDHVPTTAPSPMVTGSVAHAAAKSMDVHPIQPELLCITLHPQQLRISEVVTGFQKKERYRLTPFACALHPLLPMCVVATSRLQVFSRKTFNSTNLAHDVLNL